MIRRPTYQEMSKPSVKDILEVLAQYDVHQVLRMRDDGDVNFSKMLIRVNRKNPLTLRVDVLIHEAHHAYYESLGIEANEERVKEETKQMMRSFYGFAYGKDQG